jgi:hypothetical protein
MSFFGHLPPIIERLGWVVLIWLVMAFCALLVLSVLPRTAAGWLALLVAGPVLLLILEGSFEGLKYLVTRLTVYQAFDRWLTLRTAGKRISALRITVALVGILGLGGVIGVFVFGVLELGDRWVPLGKALSATGEFIEANYWP